MALVTQFEKVGMEKPRVHDEVECTYTVFSDKNGRKYIQLNTFGSKSRQIPGKQSQTIQLSESAVRALREIFLRATD